MLFSKLNYRRIVSFVICYSLTLNNLLYASLPIVVSDNNKETKVYYNPEEDEETIVIDIANTINNDNNPIYRYDEETNEDKEIKISINSFKLFNTENKKIIINNSNKRTKSKLLKNKEIEANGNYDDSSSIADIIVFFLEDEVDSNNSNSNNTNILSYSSFEVLGSVNNFIFLGSNNIIAKGLRYTDSISKLTLAAGTKYDIDNDLMQVISNNSKISLLPTEDEDHISIDASELNELNIIAREIDLSGEIIVKGSLAITTGLEKDNNDNNNKPKYSFQTSSFGNIQASSLRLINLEENTDINIIDTSIVTILDKIDINLKKGNTLSLNNAKVISEQSTLAIKADNLKLNNSSILSSVKDMMLNLQDTLVNDNKSKIYTQSGGSITIETQGLRNIGASVIQSGDKLNINTGYIDNFGINNPDTLSIISSAGDMTLILKNNLFNNDRSIIYTKDGGNILLQLDNLINNGSSTIQSDGKLEVKANSLSLDNSSTISSHNDMILILKGNLFNNNKSIIHTKEGGSIAIETQELRNLGTSTIHSGGELRVNGKLLENIGVNSEGNIYNLMVEYTGLKPWKNIVPFNKEKVEVTMTTTPSQILAEGAIKLDVDNIQNRGSEIASKDKLIINGIILNNERLSFDVNIHYETKRHWKRRRYIKKNKQKYEIQHYNNPELFYSNTPSLLMGNEVEINLVDILTQDSRRIHRDRDFVKSGSRIEATNELIINSKRMLNRGIIISSTHKEFITIGENLDNIGGVILSRTGGKVKADTLLNNNLVRQFNAGGQIFTEEVQPAIIGTSTDPKQLAIDCGRSSIANPEENMMIIEARHIENIGSYLISVGGTTKVIADKFKSTAQEIRNRIEGSGSVLDVTQNFKAGILGNNIEFDIKDTAEISGTDIKLNKLKIKAKQLAIADVKNKYYEEHTREEKNLLSSKKEHTLASATQSVQTTIEANTIDIETEGDIDMTAVVMNAKDISIESKYGNVNIEGATEETKQLEEHSKKTFAGLTGSISWRSASVGVKSKSTEDSETIKNTNVVSSFIRATGSFFAKAKGYFRAKATNIEGNDIDIEAEEGDVIITSMLEKHNHDTSHEELTTIVSFKVGNSYADVAATSQATAENLKKVKEALDNFNYIVEEYNKGRASKRALADVTENLAIMTTNAGMSATQIFKATSAAAATTATGGFYAMTDIQVSGSRQITEAEQIKHIHSQIKGNNINIKSGKNANIQGNIKGKESIDINIEGDLSLESTQDTNEYYANDKQLGFTAGVDQGSVALGSSTSEHSSKYTKQTSIDSEGIINIDAKGNLHLKGAAITNNDEDKLNINVNSITHEDMENEEHNIDTGINFDTGVGDKVFQGTTTIGLTDKENIKESVTRSTISKSNNINIKEGNIDGLNRDKERIEEVTRDEILSANDFDITLDNRLLTKEGRDEIVRDIVDLPNNLKKIINDITITADMVTSYIKTLNKNNEKPLDQQITVIWDETLIASNSPSAATLAIVTDPDIVKSTIELFSTMGIALMPGDTIIIPATLAVGGTYLLYRGGKIVVTIIRKRREGKKDKVTVYRHDDQVTVAAPNPMPPKEPKKDEEEKEESKRDKKPVRTEPQNLNEKLALEEAKSGSGEKIEMTLKDPKYNDGNWCKKQYIHVNPDGTKINIHYFENLLTGAREGFKFK